MTVNDVRRLLREACEDAGGQAAFARSIRISREMVRLVLAGERKPGEAILGALGLERVVNVTYRRVRRDAR